MKSPAESARSPLSISHSPTRHGGNWFPVHSSWETRLSTAKLWGRLPVGIHSLGCWKHGLSNMTYGSTQETETQEWGQRWEAERASRARGERGGLRPWLKGLQDGSRAHQVQCLLALQFGSLASIPSQGVQACVLGIPCNPGPPPGPSPWKVLLTLTLHPQLLTPWLH